VAILLGFKFPDNFNAPYTALSIQDFWRRWHMTLSRWLRDYLYVPLGGSYAGRGRTYRNLMITMLLGGLWHGAAWKFVIWGGLHGGWLAWERYRQELRVARGLPAVAGGPAHRALQRVVTFHLVCFAWIFFRADTLGVAWQMIWRLFTAWGAAPIVTPAVLLAIAVGIGAQYVSRPTVERGLAYFSRLNVPAQGVALAFGLMLIDALGPQGVAAFIYFQF
jgi:D-alanyl-lipoteichoic acid acyltransferase DltB (MBOAT superfamily)